MSQELDGRDRMVLERAIAGVEADLDEIRDNLSESLESFEKALNRAIQGLPEWLAVEGSTVLRWYQFDVDGTTLLMGPRTVAFVASRVETTFLQGFKDGQVIAESQFRNHLDETLAKIKQVEQLARTCALEVDAQLSDTLEDIIFDLEEKRERDERALRELVTSGDVDRGSETQKEIADLWEEQRARADEVRHVWERLERLVFEGIEVTGDGLMQLREVLSQMEVLGLGIRSDEPQEAIELDEDRKTEKLQTAESTGDWKRDDEDESLGSTDLDLVGPTEPLDIPGAFRHADRERETEELDREEFKSEEIPEPEPAPVELLVESGEAAQDEPEAVLDDMDDMDAQVSDVVIEDSEPPKPTLAKKRQGIDEAISPRTVPKQAQTGPEKVLATRIVREWEGVEIVERFLVLGPFLIFVVVVAGARLMESSPVWAYSPMVFPFGFCGVVGWLVLGAIIRHWRVSWPGFKLVHWVEYEEESDCEFVGDRVRVDGRWLGGNPEVYRWKSEENGGFGWWIKDDHLAIVSSERNFTRWSTSEHTLREVPYGAWNVPDSVVDIIRGVN